MIRAENCEKLPKFVKVTAKILSVPFSQTRCICYTISQVVNLKRNDDPRLSKPERDLTSGALADDFRLNNNITTYT